MSGTGEPRAEALRELRSRIQIEQANPDVMPGNDHMAAGWSIAMDWVLSLVAEMLDETEDDDA